MTDCWFRWHRRLAVVIVTLTVALSTFTVPRTASAQQYYSASLTGGSGLSLGGAAGSVFLHRTPGFLDVGFRTWSDTSGFVYGASIRSEIDGRISVGLVPRIELTRTAGRLTVHPGLGAVLFFAPYSLIGLEASVTAEYRLGSVVSIAAWVAIDGLFLGSDVPNGTAVFMANGALGVVIHL